MTTTKLKRNITNQESLTKALLRAQDHITHAISEMCDADRDIEQVVRVLEAGSLPIKKSVTWSHVVTGKNRGVFVLTQPKRVGKRRAD